MTSKAPSLEDIKTGFVFQSLDTIVGEPTYKSLELAHSQCIRNATTVDTRLGGGGHGHAGLVEFPDVYLLRTGNHFNRPTYPGDNPSYALGADPQQRETTLLLWQTNTKLYTTCQRIEKILLSMVEQKQKQKSTYLALSQTTGTGTDPRFLAPVGARIVVPT
jgi:hypothetical protein